MKTARAYIISGVVVLLGGLISVAAEPSPQNQIFNQPFTAQELAAIGPALKDASKYDKQFGRQLALTVQPQPAVSNFQGCGVIAASGYVGSVIAQQTVGHNGFGEERMASKPSRSLTGGLAIPTIRHIRNRILSSRVTSDMFVEARTDDLLVQAPAVPPPTPRTGSPVTTNPRTPWGWIVAKSPYLCAIGSASVSAPSNFPFKPGELVELRVTITVLTSYSLAVEDTYRLTAQGSGALNFSKIVVAGALVGYDPIYIQSNVSNAVRRMPNGVFIGFQTFSEGTPGRRMVCNYKPAMNGFGAGSISCTPGAPWPLRR